METGANRQIYQFLRRGPPRSNKEIEFHTGFSRATTTSKLKELLKSGLISDQGFSASEGGRPARTYSINADYRNVIGVDIGEKMGRACLFDLKFQRLDERLFDLDLTADPVTTLETIVRLSHEMAKGPKATAPVATLGIGLPAPIDYRLGRVASPSIMFGWETLELRNWLGDRLSMPVALDNDVNLMCLAEHRIHFPQTGNLIFIKAGTGIGCGIINDGRLLRGAFGTSGDIGHIQHPSEHSRLCRCGKEDCVEAHAAGWAIARDLNALGLDCSDARSVMALYARREPECLKSINQSSRAIGTACADLVAILNPEILVVGGTLSIAGEAMLAGIRERVYQRCLPLATERLLIQTSRRNERLGATGAAMLAVDDLLAPTGHSPVAGGE